MISYEWMDYWLTDWLLINWLTIDWLIDYYLTPSKQYFSNIHDEEQVQ